MHSKDVEWFEGQFELRPKNQGQLNPNSQYRIAIEAIKGMKYPLLPIIGQRISPAINQESSLLFVDFLVLSWLMYFLLLGNSQNGYIALDEFDFKVETCAIKPPEADEEIEVSSTSTDSPMTSPTEPPNGNL